MATVTAMETHATAAASRRLGMVVMAEVSNYFASIAAPSMASTSLKAWAVTGSRAERRRR